LRWQASGANVTTTTLVAFAMFSFVASVTPGPDHLMLLASDFMVMLIAVAILCAVVTMPCVACWTLFGSLLRRWLGEPRRARVFNMGMAALLVLSLIPMLL
jgi:threonine/homoserine/homoserine lactone efflux protein